jgi:hypothetical protein
MATSTEKDEDRDSLTFSDTFDFLIRFLDVWLNIITGIVFLIVKYDKLPICGILLIIFALLPCWPYALFDFWDRQWGRCLVALVGCPFVMKYEGVGNSPEFSFLAAALGALPKCAVMYMAMTYGFDLLFTGQATWWSDWLVYGATLLNGAVIAPAAAELYEAVTQCVDASHPLRRYALWRQWYWKYIVYASDMISLASVVGTLGARFSPSRFLIWTSTQWLLIGLWPAIAAPIPTASFDIPNDGWKWLVHRCVSSLVGFGTVPPLDCVLSLPPSQRWVWPFAALLRAALIVVTIIIIWHALGDPIFVAMDYFVLFCVIISVCDTVFRAAIILTYPVEDDEVSGDY